MVRKRIVLRFGAVLTLLAAPAAFGQGVPVLKRGNVELGGFGGATFGSSINQLSTAGFVARGANVAQQTFLTPSSNGLAGAHFGLALSRNFVLYGEVAYLAGGRFQFNQDVYVTDATRVEQRITADGSLNSVDFNGGLEYRWQTRRIPKLVPYLTAGVGGLRSSINLQQAALGQSPGLKFSGTFTETQAAGNGGGGIRYFFTEHAGLRVEMKGYKGEQGLGFGRLAFGLFYQFR